VNTIRPNFINGTKYALFFVAVGASMGFLYGIWSGIVYGPMVFAISLTGIFVVLNFPFALILFILNLFPAMFRKASPQLNRYFIYSLAFLLVYLIFFLLFKFLGLKPF
jgi:hypothetical protein